MYGLQGQQQSCWWVCYYDWSARLISASKAGRITAAITRLVDSMLEKMTLVRLMHETETWRKAWTYDTELNRSLWTQPHSAAFQGFWMLSEVDFRQQIMPCLLSANDRNPLKWSNKCAALLLFEILEKLLWSRNPPLLPVSHEHPPLLHQSLTNTYPYWLRRRTDILKCFKSVMSDSIRNVLELL